MSRISRLTSEYKISSKRIIDTLKILNPNKSFSINEKLNQFELDFLKKEFSVKTDMKLNQFKQADFYTFDIDDEFYFAEKETSKFESEYLRYVELVNDIENLKFKNNKYWGLDKDEINAILRIKYNEIDKIQCIIKTYRDEIQEKHDKIMQANQDKEDLNIHSEAKAIESWNID